MALELKFEEFQQALRDLAPKLNAEMAQGLTAEGDKLLAAANETCPVKTGALKASGEVIDASSPDVPRVVVGYTADYAVAVHEGASPEHGGKWFESAANRFEAQYVERVVEMVNGAIEKAAK